MAKNFNKKVAVVLVAYKAEKTLKQTYDAIPKAWVDDVILCDDASPDKTTAVARSLNIPTFVHPVNRGYGANQKTCYREALKRGADIVVMVHPDFQYDPKFIPAMIKPIAEGKAEAVFGSRMMIPKNALAGGMPYWKFIANIALTILENGILGLKLTEYHSGFRAYSRKALELPIELNSNNFVFDTEIIVQLKLAKMRISEIPISTRYFPEASMIGFWRSVQYGVSILKVMGRYLLHTMGVIHPAAFRLDTTYEYSCRLCGEKKSQLHLHGNLGKDEFSKPYLITDEQAGRYADIYHCLACGAFFIPDAQLPHLRLKEYYNESPIDSVYLGDEKGRRRTALRVLRTLAHTGAKTGEKLLDFGCSAGIFLAEARDVGYAVSGVELSKQSVEYARATYRLEHVQCGGEELLNAFPENHFDIVTAFDVLEHVPSPITTLNALRRVMKPGGLMVLTFPDISSPGARILGARWHALVPSHLTYFSRSAVAYLLREAHLQEIRSAFYKRYFSLGYILRRLFRLQENSWLTAIGITVPINSCDELELYLRKQGIE